MTAWNLRRAARAACLGATLIGLGACVYQPPPPPSAGYAYAPAPGYYAAPQPGYYAAPAYAYPPVVGEVNLGFGYWGGGGGRRHWR